MIVDLKFSFKQFQVKVVLLVIYNLKHHFVVLHTTCIDTLLTFDAITWIFSQASLINVSCQAPARVASRRKEGPSRYSLLLLLRS